MTHFNMIYIYIYIASSCSDVLMPCWWHFCVNSWPVPVCRWCAHRKSDISRTPRVYDPGFEIHFTVRQALLKSNCLHLAHQENRHSPWMINSRADLESKGEIAQCCLAWMAWDRGPHQQAVHCHHVCNQVVCVDLSVLCGFCRFLFVWEWEALEWAVISGLVTFLPYSQKGQVSVCLLLVSWSGFSVAQTTKVDPLLRLKTYLSNPVS